MHQCAMVATSFARADLRDPALFAFLSSRVLELARARQSMAGTLSVVQRVAFCVCCSVMLFVAVC